MGFVDVTDKEGVFPGSLIAEFVNRTTPLCRLIIKLMITIALYLKISGADGGCCFRCIPV